jgi:hypothetical protein
MGFVLCQALLVYHSVVHDIQYSRCITEENLECLEDVGTT